MRPIGRIVGAGRSGVDLLDQATPAPNGGSILRGWFKRLSLLVVTKTLDRGDVGEATRQIDILGLVKAAGAQDLKLYPEGERAWGFKVLYTEAPLEVGPDDQVKYRDVLYRVVKKPTDREYGYSEYYLISEYRK